MTHTAPLVWHKSSYSNGSGGNCIAAAAPDRSTILVRDTKVPGGQILNFTCAAWQDFVTCVQRPDWSVRA
ncbi:DUF397 domain-containing protein [Streptomyces sp. Je 1-4]|uniref:DUF397 domain-containing protein n=1 Tax=Streptomyces TaxID=1883 RepID=UPI0021D9CE72|nr:MULTISPECIES: DUF397 domain-containing protein [unclassified Streptomyces]UYB41569.1 DUF397 domain-containing protein [Streptomyces sp. Je 1-4]UZQ37814.1 DUF397 domain-containing protein [Streptomyces sp. Je 1-4] [Streptomyces sp. Je 1-4 4N24]UZQ45231.1 DUF397 domain-containing protein [Streptomyces sp. Je 1-4] [Streptomyces sp. Je 1-4 4N24_ara]